MATSINCPPCTATFDIAQDVRGQKMFCAECGAALVIPGQGIAMLNRGGERFRPFHWEGRR